MLKSLLIIATGSLLTQLALADAPFQQVEPDIRQMKSVDSLPDNPFKKLEVVTSSAIQTFDAKYKELLNNLMEEGLNGLIWHSTPSNRSVLIGSTSLQEGQVIPNWLAGAGPDFRLVEIGINYLGIEHLPNETFFEIEFATRTSYERLLSQARPSKKTSVKPASDPTKKIGPDGKPVESPLPEEGEPKNNIFPKIKTFTREAVAERRRKEDELFFLQDSQDN
jgi:hypothetical protein